MLARLPYALGLIFAARRPDGAELIDAGIDQAVAKRGRRDGAEALAGEGPEFLAALRIVGGQVFVALKEDFVALPVLDDDRRDPVDAARAVDAPVVFAGARVDGDRERVAHVLQAVDQQVLVENGRRRHADVVANGRVIADERTVPLEVAVAVEGGEVAGGEEGIDVFAVGHRRGRGHVGLGMAKRAARRPQGSLPELLTACHVETEDVELILLDATRGGDEGAAASEDRVRQAAAGQLGFPANALLFAPRDRQAGLGGGAVAARYAGLRGGASGETCRTGGVAGILWGGR